MGYKADREYPHDHEAATDDEISRSVRGKDFFAARGRKSPNPNGRPKADITKKQLTVRFDADLVESFKADGPGWQTRMNDMLREAKGL